MCLHEICEQTGVSIGALSRLEHDEGSDARAFLTLLLLSLLLPVSKFLFRNVFGTPNLLPWRRR
jgi:hypothetical protein